MERLLELQIMNYYDRQGDRFMAMSFYPNKELGHHLTPQRTTTD